jgi:hypothetical protein
VRVLRARRAPGRSLPVPVDSLSAPLLDFSIQF